MAEKTLENVQVGDLVVLVPKHNRSRSIEKVARVTNSQVVLAFPNFAGNLYDVKFHKKNGREVGGDTLWGCQYIHIPKEGEVEAIQERTKRSSLISRIGKADLGKLSTERLEAILALCQQEEKGGENVHEPHG